MSALTHKIDFAAIVTVTNANPNGDPLNGNRPRETYDGHGEISDVCIKRKLRNRLQDMGEKIFVQSDDRCDDGYDSLKSRADGCKALKEIFAGKKTDKEAFAKAACNEWIDVRSFGQVFAFKDPNAKKEKDDAEKGGKKDGGVSVGIRGPVSIQPVISVSPIDIISSQIVKSVNGESGKEGKSSDTMGMKHRVEFGLYLIKGSINCQLAEKTGFSEEDAEKIKHALATLFENDCSAARPDGSMEVCQVFWWAHKDKTPVVTTAKIHRSLKVEVIDPEKKPTCYEDYKVTVTDIPGAVKPEILTLL